ncbi:MAG: orotate phosphoribosyltransferase [bacterium]|nr:orotate phosphoribosyltransferase [bacterium]
MDRTQLAKKIRSAAYLTGQFTLRSGKTSDFYWDKYRIESDPELLGAIVDELETLLPPSFDRLAGLELGGVPLATGLALKLSAPCLFVRKNRKTYGTCNLIEGGFQKGEIAVAVEDVVTTAGQLCESIAEMRTEGLTVTHALCIIDRQQGGTENLQKIGCTLQSVFTLKELESLTR